MAVLWRERRDDISYGYWGWESSGCALSRLFLHSFGCARSLLLPLGLWSLLQHVESSCCGMWDIVPRPGVELMPPALGAQSVCLWTSKEAPLLLSEWGIVATFLSFFWALELRRSKESKMMRRAGCTDPGNWVVPGVHPLTWQLAHLRLCGLCGWEERSLSSEHFFLGFLHRRLVFGELPPIPAVPAYRFKRNKTFNLPVTFS